jgi:hypothetical protein
MHPLSPSPDLQVRCSAAMPAPSEASPWPNLQPWPTSNNCLSGSSPADHESYTGSQCLVHTDQIAGYPRSSLGLRRTNLSPRSGYKMLKARLQESRVSKARLMDQIQRDLRRSRRASAPGSTGTQRAKKRLSTALSRGTVSQFRSFAGSQARSLTVSQARRLAVSQSRNAHS